MKVLFIVTGIGYGDATREHANIAAFKKKYPKSKILVAGYDNSYRYFKNKYKTIWIKGYKLPGKSLKINVLHFALRNLFLPAFWVLGTLKVRLEAFNFIPDIIVSDFEPVGISLSKVLFRKCVVVFGFDPLLYKEYRKKHKVSYKMRVEAAYFTQLYAQAHFVIIPSFQAPKPQLEYAYVKPILRVMPQALPSQQVLMKKLKLKRKPILIMLGGSNFGFKLVKHINKLAERIDEDFVVFGGKLDLEFPPNVEYIAYTDKFFSYLKVCKAVITLGGQMTLAEALVYKKPVLCFPIQGHIEQVLNAYSLRDVVCVSHRSSYKDVRKVLPRFLRNLSSWEKKVKKFNLQAGGQHQVVELIAAMGKK